MAFFKISTHIVLALLMASTYAETSSTKKIVDDLTGQAMSIHKNIDSRSKELNDFMGIKRDMLKGMIPAEKPEAPAEYVKKGEGPEKATPENTEILLFISQSLGQKEIKSIYLDVASYRNTLLVYKGLKKGENFTKGVLALQAPIDKKDPNNVPRVDLDPTLFQRYNVIVAPTAVVLYQGKILLKVTGMTSPKKIYEKLHEGAFGDAGKYGPVTEIIEIDFIEMLKKRASKIDWTKKKDSAVDNFWKNRKHILLPHATKDISYTIDPLIKITKDIKTPDGKIIAKVGDVLNPLKVRAWDKDLVIFDGTSDIQIAYVKDIIKTNKVKNPILMMTNFSDEKDWDKFNKLQNELGYALYLVKPEVITRFKLEKTPSIVTEKNGQFVVNEVKLNEE